MRIPESMQTWFGQTTKPTSFGEALEIFCRPPRTQLLRRERELASTAVGEWLDWGGGRVRTYRWGEAPFAVLVHGWGGRGLQLGGVTELLLGQRVGVLAVDHPGHGESDGEACTALMVAEVLLALGHRFPGIRFGVAHSFGAIGLMLAIRDSLNLEKVALLAPSADVPTRFREFATAVGYTQSESDAFLKFCDEKFGPGRLEQASPVNTAMYMRAECLIIHDEDDREVEFDQVQDLASAWTGCEFRVTQGLGHFRLIRDRKILAAVVDFLTANR